MSKPFKFDESGDSADLQALFDSFATDSPRPATPIPVKEPYVEVVGGTAATGDSPELEALFDSVAGQMEQPHAAAPGPDAGLNGNDHIFRQLGQMTRQLHDTLRELGYDRALEEAAKAIPDARQRLTYVAQMTEQAASRVLNATDEARPIQERLQTEATALGGRWDRLFGGDLSVEEFKTLAGDTRGFLGAVPERAAATNDQLMEIMMAQDFQDLTGQVIKKIVELAQRMESDLLNVLLEAMPEDIKLSQPQGLLNGPVISAEGRTDVVKSQEQVDDLLESLGF